MEDKILGDYIKEVHKLKDELLAILVNIKDVYSKIIDIKEKGERMEADLEKAKTDIEDLKPKVTP